MTNSDQSQVHAVDSVGTPQVNPDRAAKVRYRPYHPPTKPGDIAICGSGAGTQADVGRMSGNVFEYFLFDIPAPDEPNYFPELAALADKLNRVFNEEVAGCVDRMRIQYGDDSIEATIALYNERVELVYARNPRQVIGHNELMKALASDTNP